MCCPDSPPEPPPKSSDEPDNPFSLDFGDLKLTPAPEVPLESPPEEAVATPADSAPRPDEHPLERVEVPTAFPFSLMIEGELTATERDKLLDLLSRESMGVREVDLEPQFSSHRILIPRISEYAGILLVQALRGSRARMKLGPSDGIFATAETREPAAPASQSSTSRSQAAEDPDSRHPAERLALTTLAAIPNSPDFAVIDVLTASATLKAKTVEVESTSEYQEILEALQRELRYKAYRRGAVAIVNFAVQLFPLHLSTHYRLLVSGTAIKPTEPLAQAPADPEPELRR